ncbi:MAG: SOS response-associated peptidase [Desulforhopalus sp.]|jgi:putative SOS response-associated peptidase YedK|nr:SOS response-associated peptidase [Desulforhopalus sp.]
MCGRFAYFGEGYHSSLELPPPPVQFTSYNIAPTQNILAVRKDPESSQAEWAILRWGLVPFWSKSAKTKSVLINARAEGIEQKPSFRGPFTYRRCVVPASGFYEWRKSDGGKQPYFIRPRDAGCFAFAGIWDHWQGEGGEVIESCAIITTEANRVLRDIHERMPVILGGDDVAAWLDTVTGRKEVLGLLLPCPEETLEAYPVAPLVNSPRNNRPECVARVKI